MKPTLLVFLFLPVGWGFLTSAFADPGTTARDPYTVTAQAVSELQHYPKTGECGRLLWETEAKRWSPSSPLLADFRRLLANLIHDQRLQLAELSRVSSDGVRHRIYAAETSEEGWKQLVDFFANRKLRFESSRRRYWGLILSAPFFAGAALLWSKSAVCALHSFSGPEVLDGALEWLRQCFPPPPSIRASEYSQAVLGYGAFGGLVAFPGLYGLPWAGDHELSLHSGVGRFENGRPFFILRGGRPPQFYRAWDRRFLGASEALEVLPPVVDSLDSAAL